MSEPRRLTPENLALLKQWEGVVLYTYDDKDPSSPKKFFDRGTPKGTLTIGYGHTRGVQPGMRITEQQAEAFLLEDLDPVERAVDENVLVPLTDEQFGALVSFAFNLGHAIGKGKPLSNILETLNKGDYDGAIRRMGLYINQGGKRNQGLVNRRAAEAGLWVKGNFVASKNVDAEESTEGGQGSAFSVATLAPLTPMIAAFSGFDWRLAAVLAVLIASGLYLFLRQQRKVAT